MRARLAVSVFPILVACSGTPAPVQQPAAQVQAGSATVPIAAPAAPSVAPAKPAVPLAELTCKTAEQSAPPGVCGELERAPRADAAAAAQAVAVFKRLEAPFRGLSGRETALVVLGPDARLGEGADAKPLPPAAMICPGAPPTVYVPASLLALIADKDPKDPKKYPEDFLAFVIGHELGHRMNDLTPDGCQLGAFQRPGQGLDEEELADARSAFFITTAGYSARKIARDDMVSRFLAAEYALGREDSKTRRESLLGALARFDGYEALYQTALAVALTGEMEAADRLLSWADELVQSHGVALPELRVVRAIIRIDRAATMAPWLAELRLPVGIEQLRCTPLHPGHSAFAEEPQGRVRSPDIERGRALLKQAIALLTEAEARGATPFTVAVARSCALLYLADASAAAEEQTRAERLLPKSADAVLKGVLADNRALVTFLAFARKQPAPALDATDALRTWTDELAKALGGARAPAGLAAVLVALRNPESSHAPPPTDAVACGDAHAKHATALAAMPVATGPGTCPSGFTLAEVLPSKDASAKTGSQQGITVCGATQSELGNNTALPSGSAASPGQAQLVTVRLASTTEPPLQALERSLLTTRPPTDLTTLDRWACNCASVERQGVSDRGQIIYRAQCPALHEDDAVLIVANGRVETLIQHSR